MLELGSPTCCLGPATTHHTRPQNAVLCKRGASLILKLALRQEAAHAARPSSVAGGGAGGC